MKNFWKNLCVGSMAVISAFGFGACQKEKPEVSIDLDGDGVIAAWEEIYTSTGYSTREISKTVEIVEISSLAELKAINEKTSETKYYKLTKDINCNGEAIAINLGNSTLLGNNRVIKNFKLGDCSYYVPNSENELVAANVKGLFYNGVAVYDMRLFIGNQTITLDNTNTQTIISPFVNVATVDNIEVRGKLNIDRKKTDGLSATNSLDVSLLSANINELDVERISTKGSAIRNATITGEIIYSEGETNTRVRIGGATPHVSKDSEVYNILSNVNIEAESSGRVYMGGIAGESDDMISTCYSAGNMDLTYTPNFESKVGGIVGSNNQNGEVKNCVTANIINFDKEIVTSSTPELYVGGIAGCNYGIMDYITTDSSLNINNAVKAQVGGVAGYSQDGIISNVISRGNINIKNVSNLYISEMIGVSKFGYIETAVVTTNIVVDNAEINSNVKLGMLTMFEDFSIDSKYNADYAPNFSGILLAGKTEVYMKPTANNSNSNSFEYNLGLRNPFEYYVLDENGDIKTEERVDASGNVVYDEDGNVIYDNVTATQVPDIYSKLFILESYSVEKYNISGDLKIKDTLTFTYAKDSSNAPIVSPCSNSRLQINFFVRYLGFKYGLNHNEIDLSTMDLSKINFTLSENRHQVKFFEDKNYNGELEYYDRYINNACTYDSSDEMYSFLNDLILSDKTSAFVPLKISKVFAQSVYNFNQGEDVEDEEDLEGVEGEEQEPSDDVIVDTTINLGQKFANSIQQIIKAMLNVEPTIYQLTSNKVDINTINGDTDPEIKYERLVFWDANYGYYLTFDVSKLIADEGETGDSYIVYLTYSKVAKY